MPDLAAMSDEQLHQEWQDTKMRVVTLSPGVEPPVYTADMAARHAAADAELIDRGYVQQTPGWWVGPGNHTF